VCPFTLSSSAVAALGTTCASDANPLTRRSFDAEVVRLQGLGLRVLAPQQPGEAFEDEMIAFLYAGDGVSIELIDTEQRAGRLPGGSIA
jgi:hypothetical protein